MYVALYFQIPMDDDNAIQSLQRTDIFKYIPKDNKTFEDRNMKIIMSARRIKTMRMSNTIHTLCVEPSESFANDSEIP